MLSFAEATLPVHQSNGARTSACSRSIGDYMRCLPVVNEVMISKTELREKSYSDLAASRTASSCLHI